MKTEPRLRFSGEERADPALKNPIRKAEKASAKADKAQAKIPKKTVKTRQRVVDPATGKVKTRLLFEEVDKKKSPSKLAHAALDAPGNAVLSSVHKEIRQKRFIRLDTLGEGYAVADLRAVLSGKKAHTPRKRNLLADDEKPVNLLVDIQAKLQAGKGAGYERCAKVFNLKQMAHTVNYLTEHNLLEYAALAEKTAASTARYNELSTKIKAAERRLAEIAVLRTHIVNYSKTRDVYAAYRKAGYSKKYLAEHEGDILLHKAAKKAFDDLGEPEELCFSGTDNCDAWFADTLRAALERLSVLTELYEPRFCDWEASSGRIESVNRFKTELKRLFSRGEKVNPSMEPMSFSVQAGGKAGGFPATPAEMEYQALVDISNLEWTGMDEAFKHASRYAEYGPYLHFYVPATGSRFAIEGDGNYYHGYDIVISRLSDVCPKQEKRELFGVHRDRDSFPLVVGKELEPGRHGWTLVSEMFSGADAAAASADKAPLPQKGPPLSADSAHSCPACGHQLIPGHPFCEHCGTSVPVCRKGEHVFHWRETAVYLMGTDGLVYDERKVKYVCKYCSITCDTLDEAQKIGIVEM